MQQKIILETNHLRLCEFHPSEAEYMYRLNLDPEVIKYTGDPPFATVREAREFLENYTAYEKYGFGRWSVWLKDQNTYIGWCGLKKHEEGWVDLGFRFFREYWNRGYATEAAIACVDYGFGPLGLPEIIGRADRENKASIRVLQKVGMTFWKADACEGIEHAVYYRISRPG